MTDMILEPTDTRTLRQIYDAHGINPDAEAIIMVLDGGHRVPFPRSFDNTPFRDAAMAIAQKLTEQSIYIDNLLNNTYARNFIHHYCTMPRSFGNRMEKHFKLSNIVSIASSTSLQSLPVLDTTREKRSIFLRKIEELRSIIRESIETDSKNGKSYDANAENSFLATFLQIVRKKNIDAFISAPDDHGIPHELFPGINNWYQQSPDMTEFIQDNSNLAYMRNLEKKLFDGHDVTLQIVPEGTPAATSTTRSSFK